MFKHKRSMKTLRYNHEELDQLTPASWCELCGRTALPIDVMHRWSDRLDWYLVSRYQRLSPEFIRRWADKLDWNALSLRADLTESFMFEYRDKLNWFYITTFQSLSESFISKMSDYVHWETITLLSNLSDEFILAHLDRFNMRYIKSGYGELWAKYDLDIYSALQSAVT